MWAGGDMGTWGPVRKKGGGVMRGGGMCNKTGGRENCAIVVTHRSVSLSRYFELGVFGVGVLLALASAVLAAAVAALVY